MVKVRLHSFLKQLEEKKKVPKQDNQITDKVTLV